MSSRECETHHGVWDSKQHHRRKFSTFINLTRDLVQGPGGMKKGTDKQAQMRIDELAKELSAARKQLETTQQQLAAARNEARQNSGDSAQQGKSYLQPVYL